MRILIISAHTADFCSRAGGTIARYTKAGVQVKVICLTYGERSESGGLYRGGQKPDLKEVKKVRHEEGTQAAGILGASIAFLDWEDLHLAYDQKRALFLAEEIRAFGPDAILTHHGPDPCSIDHDVCWRLVMGAVQLATTIGLESDRPPAKPAPVFLFEATIPLTEAEGFNPHFYIDITDTWETKLAALKAFDRAQGFLAGWYTDQARLRAFQARRITGNEKILYAEAFERTLPWVGNDLPLWG